MRSLAILGVGALTVAALAGIGTTQSGSDAPAANGLRTYVTQQGALAHQYDACGKLTTTVTPLPGHGPLTAEQLGMPPAAEGMLREIAQHHYTWLPSTSCLAMPQHTTPQPTNSSSSQKSSINAADNYSANWSGYKAPVSSPRYAHAKWTVPFIGGHPTADVYSVIWPGIGSGNSGNELVQAGTEQDVLCSGQCQSYSRPVFFWYEIVPGEAEQKISLNVKTGDTVASAASWSSGRAAFVLCNRTAGQCWNGSQSSAEPTKNVEWIVERPTIHGIFPPLADFRHVTMSVDTYGTGGAHHAARTGHAHHINMVDCNETMSSVGSLTGSAGSAFEATWHHYC